jgi:hypothetical protein
LYKPLSKYSQNLKKRKTLRTIIPFKIKKSIISIKCSDRRLLGIKLRVKLILLLPKAPH